MGFDLPYEKGVMRNIMIIVLKVRSSNEIEAHKLFTNTIGTFEVQERFKVCHAFTHGHLKSTPSALVRRSKAVTSHSSKFNYLVLFRDTRSK